MNTAHVNWHGHNIIITYTQGENISSTYSAGMWNSQSAIDMLYGVIQDSNCKLVSVSCPTEFLDELNYSRPNVIDAIRAGLPGLTS